MRLEGRTSLLQGALGGKLYPFSLLQPTAVQEWRVNNRRSRMVENDYKWANAPEKK